MRSLDDRYSVTHRQELIAGFNQERLANAKGCFVGAGANSLLMLQEARKGIGAMTVLDHDSVDAGSNLNRQFFYPRDIFKPKAWRLINNLAPHCTNPGGAVLTGIRLRFEDAVGEGFDFSDCDFFVCIVDNGHARAAVSTYFRERGIPGVFCALSLDALVGYVFIQESKTDTPCIGCKFSTTLYAKTKRCFVPSSIDIVTTITGLASFAIDTLLMPQRKRGWNWRLVSLNGFLPDESLIIKKNNVCPLCGTGKERV